MGYDPITIWAIADGRPGHWNQVRGLVEALARRVMVRDIAIPAPSRLQSSTDLLQRRWKATDHYPDPDFIIGAGHATHLPMLIARTSRGGRAVVLMRPTFPTNMFDLCLIPETQVRKPQSNIVGTRGAINRIRPARNADLDAGLILIGGPSRHVRWRDKPVLEQVFEVCTRSGDMHWQISTSRRTPPELLHSLYELGLLNATIVDGRKTGPEWVPEQLSRCGAAWVTSDSVSMVYESLTAGASVGLLTLPMRKQNGKIARSITELKDRGDIMLFEDWQATYELNSPAGEFREADRCAEQMLARFFHPLVKAA